jgi:plastocyanin
VPLSRVSSACLHTGGWFSPHELTPARLPQRSLRWRARAKLQPRSLFSLNRSRSKRPGPKETINAFGELYAFSPTFIAVHRDEPTLITFWNLQPDDDHDFALLGPDLNILMYVDLPPLKKTSYVFTFHKEGLFDFKCMQHQPAMGGQFLVLPPVVRG